MKFKIVLLVCFLLILPPLYASAAPLQPVTKQAAQLTTRATVDRLDDFGGYQVHILYVVPADGVDNERDINGELEQSVNAFQGWLEGQTGGQKLRIDTFNGDLDITFVRLGGTEAQLYDKGVYIRDEIELQLTAGGFNNARKIYAVYYDGNAAETCGGGARPPELIGQVGAVYLQGTFADEAIPDCGTNPIAATPQAPGYVSLSMLHEILHTMGIVPACAPHHTREGHSSDDPTDVMYAGDEAWNPSILDIGHNDYFAHDNADCLDLADSTFMEPTAENAWIPPGWTADESGSIPSGLHLSSCSGQGDPVTITFVNNTQSNVNIYWVDFDCIEVFFDTLAPHTQRVQETFVTHRWRIRSVETGDLWAETVAVEGQSYTVTVE